jgi:Bacterial Ig domain
MIRRISPALLLLVVVAALPLFAQGPRPPLPTGLGGCVLIAENSIQLERDVAILSGNVVVNGAASGPVLGERELSLDRGVTTASGSRLSANGIDIDRLANVAGNLSYNTLTNDGTVTGTHTTTLTLPVFSHLPPAFPRMAGTEDITVGAGSIVTIDEGDYQDLIVEANARVDFSGGGYTFRSITVAKGVALRFLAGSNVVVTGRIYTNKEVTIGPHPGATIGAAAILIQVQGQNGTDGALSSFPPAVWFGHRNSVKANVHATAGTIVFEHEVSGSGSFIARDILAGKGSRFSVESRNNAVPVADPQTVFTNGFAPLPITLTGSDPEGAPLQFTIATMPANGTVSMPPPMPAMSAVVTYTPSTGADLTDSFAFRVRDNAGASGVAIITINPGIGDAPTQPVGGVIAHERIETMEQDIPAMLHIGGDAPPGVSLTFSIVPATGPFHGTLGPLQNAPENPVRHARMPYTPDPGFNGDDTLQYEACGVVNGQTMCDTATMKIRVMPKRAEPPQPTPIVAEDVEASTSGTEQVAITLNGVLSQSIGGRFVVKSDAVVNIPAVMAGAVADANNDGIGDNVNPLPGPGPVIAGAARGVTGGPGSNGEARFEIEFNISSFTPAGVNALASASITLPTMRGPVDSLPTHFWLIGENNDGALTVADYARVAEKIPGITMPVPPSQPVGTPGTFTFDALPALKGAVAAGQNFLTIQGRVDPVGPPGRGLGVRTTAGPNVNGGQVPSMMIATPGLVAPLIYHVTSLPQHGTLVDSSNNAITNVPYMLSQPIVKYTANAGYLGDDSFTFSVSNGQSTDQGTATIHVVAPDCGVNEADCDNGRD